MPDLLPEALRQRLLRLRMRPRQMRTGGQKGERRSARRGTSLEFADFRNYVAGDDLRKLDWNAYARLDRPIIKLYEDEQDALIHLLLDDSGSMGALPDDPTSAAKGLAARQIAAGLGFIALNTNDRLTLTRLSQPQEPIFSGRGRASVAGLLRALETQPPSGAVDLIEALRHFSQRERRGGMVFLISDLFTEGDLDAGLRALLAAHHEVTLLHTLSPEEQQPTLSGDLRLIDVETNAPAELTITADLYDQYRQSLEAWQKGIRAACARRGVRYLTVTTGAPLEPLFLRDLRRVGVVV
ncbi:MAG: DUF58 domain-containing protein [Anaerolineae bacterium]